MNDDLGCFGTLVAAIVIVIVIFALISVIMSGDVSTVVDVADCLVEVGEATFCFNK